MSQKIVLVGGCGGIGRALVRAIQAAGQEAIVLDLETSIAAHPLDAQTFAVDVNRTESVAEAVGQLVGEISGFVYLSGFMTPNASLDDTLENDWTSVLDTNLTGAYRTATSILPKMAKDSSMVFIGSGLGHLVRPGYGPYAISKAGLAALSRQFALELAPDVRANCVAPSAVDTAFLRGGTGRSDETQPTSLDVDSYAQAIPMQRIATPNDIVGPVMFLLSDASAYITGQVLHVNGGTYMP